MQPHQRDTPQPKFFRLNDVNQRPVVSPKIGSTSDPGVVKLNSSTAAAVRTTPSKQDREKRPALTEVHSSANSHDSSSSAPVYRRPGATSPVNRHHVNQQQRSGHPQNHSPVSQLHHSRSSHALHASVIEPEVTTGVLMKSPDIVDRTTISTSPTASSGIKYKATSNSPLGKSQRQIKDLEISNKSLLTVNKFLEKRIRRQQEELDSLRQNTGGGGDLPSSSLAYNDDPEDPQELQDLKELEEADKEFPEVQKETMNHLERLKAVEDTNRRLHKCIYITERLLRDAEAAVKFHVDPEEIRIGGRVLFHDSDDEGSDDERSDDKSDDKNLIPENTLAV